MKAREYCCCAIPTVNAGIYTTLLEQFTLGMVVAILALATPNIVGAASIPSIAPTILAIVAFILAGVQVLGFWGVLRDRPQLFRRYSWFHMLVTLAAFAVAAAWIIISATNHNTAVSHCQTNFFSDFTNSTTIDVTSEGQTLCNIFSWVDVGIMGGLWVLLAIMQLYLFTVISGYASSQRFDRDQYYALPFDKNSSGDIPLTSTHNDAWDAHDDDSSDHELGPGHVRGPSAASVSTILAEKPQEPAAYNYSDTAYPEHQDNSRAAGFTRQPSSASRYQYDFRTSAYGYSDPANGPTRHNTYRQTSR